MPCGTKPLLHSVGKKGSFSDILSGPIKVIVGQAFVKNGRKMSDVRL